MSVPDKEELKRAECNLAPTSDELAFIEQLYIYLGLTKPTDKLFISFATVGSKGESLIPSYLIEVLRNMYEGLSINICTTYKPNLFETDIKDDTGRLLGLYVSGLEVDEEKLFKNIGILRTTQEGREWCDKVIENAFREHKPTVINEKTAKELYGNLLKVSISTLEQFARCQYAYFVGDGLKLSEREEYGLEIQETCPAKPRNDAPCSIKDIIGKDSKQEVAVAPAALAGLATSDEQFEVDDQMNCYRRKRKYRV